MSDLTIDQIQQETKKTEDEIAGFIQSKLEDLQKKLDIQNQGKISLEVSTAYMDKIKYWHPTLIVDSVKISLHL